jgi:hypothetical protein
MKNFIFLLFISFLSNAQIKPEVSVPVKPTPIEFLMGNNRIQGQTIIVKNFAKSKFGIFSLSTLAGDYKNADKSNNEVFSNVQLHYDFFKGLKVTSGATFSSSKGFSPIAGLEYFYTNKYLTLVINPTINLTKSSSIANYAHIEYAPKNAKLNPYVRLQTLYVNSIAGKGHERSAAVARFGVIFKGFASGLGLNKDYYGPTKNPKSNIGLFLHYKFI